MLATINKNKTQHFLRNFTNFKPKIKNYKFLLRLDNQTACSFLKNTFLKLNLKLLTVSFLIISFCLLQGYIISHSIAHNFTKTSATNHNHSYYNPIPNKAQQVKNDQNFKADKKNKNNECNLCLFANFYKKISNFNLIIFSLIIAKIIFDIEKILIKKIKCLHKNNCRSPPFAI